MVIDSALKYNTVGCVVRRLNMVEFVIAISVADTESNANAKFSG